MALKQPGVRSFDITIPVDGQGRMRPEDIPPLTEPAIICIQAGNVNTGAFDPATDICEVARASDSWVHVDGAFGLWAAACPDRANLAAGIAKAHSWATTEDDVERSLRAIIRLASG